MQLRHSWRSLALCAITAILVIETACLMAVAPAKHAYKGRTDQLLHNVDFAFLKPGVTTHAEVTQRLDWLTPGANLDRLYVGRFVDSRWYMAYAGGNNTGVPAGAGRVWSGKHVVVEFDESGRVARYAILSDKNFPVAMTEALQRTQPRDAIPESMAADRHHAYTSSQVDPGTLYLRAEELEFRDSTTNLTLTIPKPAIRNIHIVVPGDDEPVPSVVSFGVDIREQRKYLGGPLLLRLKYSDFISFLRYLR